ncbi:perlucin-like [Crassostrea virginica]
MRPSHLVVLVGFCSAYYVESCLTGWVQFQDKCYMFNSMAKEWGVASGYCHAFNAKLAEPQTEAEGHFLSSHAQKLGGNFWIGVTDLIEEDIWMYPSTQRLFNMTSSLWSANKPNGYTTANCGLLFAAFHGKMGDYNCVYPEKFICELSNEMYLK